MMVVVKELKNFWYSKHGWLIANLETIEPNQFGTNSSQRSIVRNYFNLKLVFYLFVLCFDQGGFGRVHFVFTFHSHHLYSSFFLKNGRFAINGNLSVGQMIHKKKGTICRLECFFLDF